MDNTLTGSNNDFSRADNFKSGSSYSIHAKSTQSFNDVSRFPKESNTRKTYASDISNRLPNIVFSGPNGIYNRRVGQYDFRQEIGIGRASGLRSLESSYITRGSSGVLQNSRRQIPNEIGWSVSYFKNIYPRCISTGYPLTKRQIPR